MLQLLYHA